MTMTAKSDKELGIETDAINWAIRSSKTGVEQRGKADKQLGDLVKLIRSLKEQIAERNKRLPYTTSNFPDE